MISTPQIAEALHSAGATVEPEHAQVLASVTAETAPSIKVTSVRRVGEKTASFSMTCANCSTRLPFIVMTDWFTASDLEKVLKNLNVNSPAHVEKQYVQRKWVVRAGENVAVLLESDKMRISTRGTCLEPGEVGSAIKVRTTDSKQVYRAEVLSNGLVKVTL
jgi:flagella basal body P-ring formation protein FlgA